MEESRILLIDDDERSLKLMGILLEQAGYSPQRTGDTREASTLLETATFDVVVSDVMMPHLSGLQILEMAKGRNPDVQVVLVTAYASRDVAIEALNKGASGFVEKPLEKEHFLAAVRQALWRQRAKEGPRSSV